MGNSRLIPLLGLGLLSFKISIDLEVFKNDTESKYAINWDWNALVWNGGGIIWIGL